MLKRAESITARCSKKWVLCSCAKTVENMCRSSLLSKYCRSTVECELRTECFKCIFKDFDHISVVHLSVVIFVFGIVGELKTPNLRVFSNIIRVLHPTIKNVVIPSRRPKRRIMLNCIGTGTPLSLPHM